MFVALAVMDSFLCTKIRTNKRDIIERLPTSFTKLPKLCKVDTNSFSLITYAKTIFEMRFNESFFDFFFLENLLAINKLTLKRQIGPILFSVFFFFALRKNSIVMIGHLVKSLHNFSILFSQNRPNFCLLCS